MWDLLILLYTQRHAFKSQILPRSAPTRLIWPRNRKTSVPARILPASGPWRSSSPAAAASPAAPLWPLPLLPPLLPPPHKSWRGPPAGPGKPRSWCAGGRPRPLCWCHRTTPGSETLPTRDPRTGHSPPGRRGRHRPASLLPRRRLRPPPSRNISPPSMPWCPGCLPYKPPLRRSGRNHPSALVSIETFNYLSSFVAVWWNQPGGRARTSPVCPGRDRSRRLSCGTPWIRPLWSTAACWLSCHPGTGWSSLQGLGECHRGKSKSGRKKQASILTFEKIGSVCGLWDVGLVGCRTRKRGSWLYLEVRMEEWKKPTSNCHYHSFAFV